jgi:hypothetical protein
LEQGLEYHDPHSFGTHCYLPMTSLFFLIRI